MKIILVFVLFVSVCFLSFSQLSQTKSDTLRKDALNVFMDASDFIKKEIPYVNYVRDIKDAGVYIITTYQRTGSGGMEYSYFLVGQHEFSGMADTLTFVTTPDETEDGIREKQVSTLKMGLMRYVAKTPLSKYLKISFSEPLSETVSTDKWDSWVLRTSIYGYISGEKLNNSGYLNGSLSANRVTEKLKINMDANYSYSYRTFKMDDTSATILSDSKSKSFNSLIVKSLNDHWSYGFSAGLSQSSFSNHQFLFSFMPGIEYDVFPYSESTRRQLRLLYKIGLNYSDYYKLTMYDKMYENLWLHSFTSAYQVVQKWGSINFSLGYSNYLHDWSKNNFSVDGYLELRIAKGLSVSFGGGASLIHNQINLPMEGLSLEDLLTYRRELETNYSFFSMFQLSYTFGSIYNNVVNPRFGNSGGGGMSISFN